MVLGLWWWQFRVLEIYHSVLYAGQRSVRPEFPMTPQPGLAEAGQSPPHLHPAFRNPGLHCRFLLKEVHDVTPGTDLEKRLSDRCQEARGLPCLPEAPASPWELFRGHKPVQARWRGLSPAAPIGPVIGFLLRAGTSVHHLPFPPCMQPGDTVGCGLSGLTEPGRSPARTLPSSAR